MSYSPTSAVRAEPWSSGQWCVYYRNNLENLMVLPWECGAEITETEREAVIASIQEFQLGESSEGRHLLRRARDYAERTGDLEYLEAMQLFIKEEQRHARELGKFLDAAGVPRLTESPVDSGFRWLRRLAGLELCITVLVIAETVGKVYYQAIRKATGSALLRRICEQLLRDEVQHIRFHAERLAQIRSERGWLVNAMAGLRHRLIFLGGMLIVWGKYRSALRAGGLNLRQYWRHCWKEMANVARLMKTRLPACNVDSRPASRFQRSKDLTSSSRAACS